MRKAHAPGPDPKTESKLVQRVRDALAGVGLKEKKMFGAIAFMVRGKLCVTARAERIMCRIDPRLHPDALKRAGCQAVVMRGRQYPGYVHVYANALQTKRALLHWIGLALSHNATCAAGAGSKQTPSAARARGPRPKRPHES